MAGASLTGDLDAKCFEAFTEGHGGEQRWVVDRHFDAAATGADGNLTPEHQLV